MDQLWPAIIGAALGLPLLIFAALWLVRRWAQLSAPLRWSLFAVLAIIEAAYWVNVYAWLIEPRLLFVRRVTIESAHWNGPPLTIAVLGDTHVASPHVDLRRMERVVRRINTLQPDLVVLLGDYVGGNEPAAMRSSRQQLEVLSGVATFAALDARLGVVAVIGNHDSWYDRRAIVAALEEAGVAVLWNRYVVLEWPGGRFVVAGLADSDTGDPDFALAVAGSPADASMIVLTHNPDAFVKIPVGPALVLAGHTHCGQVTIPFLGRPVVPSAYGQKLACGLIDENGRQMFVTAGLGTSKLPVRFLNPPEIALITLRAPAPID